MDVICKGQSDLNINVPEMFFKTSLTLITGYVNEINQKFPIRISKNVLCEMLSAELRPVCTEQVHFLKLLNGW